MSVCGSGRTRAAGPTQQRVVSKSRRIGRGHVVSTRRGRTVGSPARPDRAQKQAIRDWAKSKGIDVSDRGRIPTGIVEQYQTEAGR